MRHQRQRLAAAMFRAVMYSIEASRLDGELGILDIHNSSRKSLGTSPSRTEVWIGEVDDEDPNESEYKLEQSTGLDPTAFFEKLARCDTKMLTPEQSITLFALRLALIEKAASGIGTLSFIWATTIILGGFASNINPVDFMVIAIVLITEGTRLFSRSKELEWEHIASKSSDISLTSRTAQAALKVSNILHCDTILKTQSSEQPGRLPREPAGRAVYEKTAAAWMDNHEGRIDCGHQNFQPTPYLKSMKTFTVQPNQTGESDGPVTSDDMRIQNSTVNMATISRGGSISILSTRGVTSILYSVQTVSAIICLLLSSWRLSIQKYNPALIPREEAPTNLYMSLNIFYTLALTQALLFLLNRVYWEYKINYDQLMMWVNGKACELREEDPWETRKHFFFEVYKKCIDGSLFDGLEMDIVTYSLTLLQSDSSSEQLGGLRMLRQIVDREDGCSMNALRRIGTAAGTLERLVEMLSWRTTNQEAIRREAATLINKGIRYSQNCFKIAAIPGSMEGIVSLLRSQERGYTATLETLIDSVNSTTLRLDGLRILLACARDPMNLLQVGDTLGLIPLLVSFIEVRDVPGFKKMEGTELETFEKALRLLTMLATVRSTSGTILRRMIVRLVTGIASLKDILEFGDCHPQLQAMAIEILTNLTLEDGIWRSIGSTSGIIRNLVALYTRKLDNTSGFVIASEEIIRKAKEAVSTMAGDALNLLAIMNKENCMLMMDLQDGNGMRTFIPALVGLLNDDREQTISAAKILRSLLEYGSHSQKQEIEVCIVRVMRLVMGSSSQQMHEAVVGLPSAVLNVVDDQTYNLVFENLDRTELVGKLLKNLEYNAQASSQFPRVRRHSIEFILALVNRDPTFLKEFMKDGLLERKLLQTLDSTREAEDFAIFSGAEGLTKHSITMENLVHNSLLELRLLIQTRSISSLQNSPFHKIPERLH